MAIQFNLYWSYLPGVTIGDNQILNVVSPYAHLNLDQGVEHFYRVTAYDTDTTLESDLSNELSATPFGSSFSDGRIIW